MRKIAIVFSLTRPDVWTQQFYFRRVNACAVDRFKDEIFGAVHMPHLTVDALYKHGTVFRVWIQLYIHFIRTGIGGVF
jgi:hypothetical protein